MGNSHCKECREVKQQNIAYGEYELVIDGADTFAVVEKISIFEENLESKL